MRALIAIAALWLAGCAAEAQVEASVENQIEISTELEKALSEANAEPPRELTKTDLRRVAEFQAEAAEQGLTPDELVRQSRDRLESMPDEAFTSSERLVEAQVTSIDELLAQARESGAAQEEREEGLTPEERRRIREYRATLQQASSTPPRPDQNVQIPSLFCEGIAVQGGLVICRTEPKATVEVGRSEDDTYNQTADENGIVIIGFDRDEPDAFVRVGEHRVDFDIAPRDYDISRIDGLPSNMVSNYSEEELARIRAATARKRVGFASMVEEIGFENGFIYPVTDHRKTTNFGAQRILNGEPKRPHFGVDLAAPLGTPILAPADDIVSLADEDMYFEGSLIMIDHGQGLISYYLHNEEVMVEAGERVVQGQQIGTVGSRGRSTGPHLCWRLKWRGRNLDPELLVNWQSEARIYD